MGVLTWSMGQELPKDFNLFIVLFISLYVRGLMLKSFIDPSNCFIHDGMFKTLVGFGSLQLFIKCFQQSFH